MNSSLKKYASTRSPKFLFLQRSFQNKPFNFLDIGAGNHSASKTKRLFPACNYYGLDLDKNYNNDEADFAAMTSFYEMDLTLLNFDVLPDSFFDAIWMVHVIEHLRNGDEVLKNLIPKLKPGGYLYIEYPGKNSTKLPSMHGSLNFKDDSTHVRLYSVKEISQLLHENGCTVVKSGTRRNIYYMAAMPFRIISHWVRGKKLQGNIFWDLLGFAEYVWARKKNIKS